LTPSELDNESLASLNIRESIHSSNRFNPFKGVQDRAARHGSTYGDGDEISECIDCISIKIDGTSSQSIFRDEFNASLNDRTEGGEVD